MEPKRNWKELVIIIISQKIIVKNFRRRDLNKGALKDLGAQPIKNNHQTLQSEIGLLYNGVSQISLANEIGADYQKFRAIKLDNLYSLCGATLIKITCIEAVKKALKRCIEITKEVVVGVAAIDQRHTVAQSYRTWTTEYQDRHQKLILQASDQGKERLQRPTLRQG